MSSLGGSPAVHSETIHDGTPHVLDSNVVQHVDDVSFLPAAWMMRPGPPDVEPIIIVPAFVNAPLASLEETAA